MNKEPAQPAGKAPKGPQRRQVKLEVPENLTAQYVNFALITNTLAEVVFDFALVLPNAAKVQVLNRLVLSPTSAKQFHKALGDMLEKYERTHGEIRVPPTLADRLFQNSSPPESPDEGQSEGENEES